METRMESSANGDVEMKDVQEEQSSDVEMRDVQEEQSGNVEMRDVQEEQSGNDDNAAEDDRVERHEAAEADVVANARIAQGETDAIQQMDLDTGPREVVDLSGMVSSEEESLEDGEIRESNEMPESDVSEEGEIKEHRWVGRVRGGGLVERKRGCVAPVGFFSLLGFPTFSPMILFHFRFLIRIFHLRWLLFWLLKLVCGCQLMRVCS